MASFTDLDGRTWDVAPNFSTFSAIAEKHRLSLTSPEKFADGWARLLSDDRLALQVVWTAVEDSANGAESKEFEFEAVMDGTRLSEGLSALLDALCECCPRHAAVYREAVTLLESRMNAAMEHSIELIEELGTNSLDELQAMYDKLHNTLKG